MKLDIKPVRPCAKFEGNGKFCKLCEFRKRCHKARTMPVVDDVEPAQ